MYEGQFMHPGKMRVLPTDFSEGLWLAQPKWDGRRVMVRVEHNSGYSFYRMYSRSGAALNSGRGCEKGVSPGLYDGEWLPSPNNVILFDALEVDGHDMRNMPLERRLTALVDAVGEFDLKVSISSTPKIMDAMCRKLNLEGVVVKRKDSKYLGGRTDLWQKFVYKQVHPFAFRFPYTGEGLPERAVWISVYNSGYLGGGRVLMLSEAQWDAMVARFQPDGTNRFSGVVDVRHSGWTKNGLPKFPVFVGVNQGLTSSLDMYGVPSREVTHLDRLGQLSAI